VGTIEELLETKSRGSGLENRGYGRMGSAAPTVRHSLSIKVALTSPTRGGRSVGIVRSRSLVFYHQEPRCVVAVKPFTLVVLECSKEIKKSGVYCVPRLMGSIMRSKMNVRNVWKLLLHLGWEGTLGITGRSLGVVSTDLCVWLYTTDSVRACDFRIVPHQNQLLNTGI
jgi:hypothetical protein